MYLPWLAGSMAPAPDDDVRGGFVGMGLSSSRADMTRAVYEGVALNAAWLLDPFRAFTGVDYREITFGGGGARSPLWGAILADALGITVHRLAEPEYTNARGAARLAFAALGGGPGTASGPYADGSELQIAESHCPDPEHGATFSRLRARFADYHAATRAWHRAARP